jgi:succinate-semialdehyde dehydrogenase/glutarate-semialdehyde dehydrogenase
VRGRGEAFGVSNPATDEVIATVNAADTAQTTEALEAAQAAFKTWSHTTLDERLAWIAKFREAILAERAILADFIAREVGKSYREADAECNMLATLLSFYSEEAKRVYGTILVDYGSKPGETVHFVRRYPVGVTVGLTAWNWPLNGAGRKIAPALAAGCTCVIKPASYTPLATLYLGAIAEQDTGFDWTDRVVGRWSSSPVTSIHLGEALFAGVGRQCAGPRHA